jgi:ABC-type sugar transport system ATPase subunit
VPAVKNVSFDLRRGEIHALLGENGAGKSTLTKIIAGVVEMTSGKMFHHGKEISYASPHAALDAGIAMVFQETSLVPSMTVAQNLYLGTEGFVQSLARHLHLGAAVSAVAEFPGRSNGHGRDARRRKKANGRDRPSRSPERQNHHLR